MGLEYRMHTRAARLKSQTNNLTKKIILGIASSAAVIGLVILPVAAAKPNANTVTVTESNPQGWAKTQVGGGTITYVASPGAPLGTGAAEFSTPTPDSYTRLRKDVDIKLSDISNLSYMTKQLADNPSLAAVNLRLYISTTGTNTACGSNFDDVLVYEPYYNGTVTSGNWQTWSVNRTTGYWWSNCEVSYHGIPTGGAGGTTTNFHLSDVLASYPDATIVSIGLGTGTDNSPWTVQADALTVNGTTYNFENEASKAFDQCKDNGWQTVQAANGANFKNQGACVSYFASNGKSQH